MGKVYSPPKAVGEQPKFDIKDYEGYCACENKYVEDIKAWAKTNGNGKYAGEVIQFPVADGYAQYVVLSLKPVALIHLPVGDAWQYQYVNRLTASDIKNEVERGRALNKLFTKRISK
jgi:hypothetical protein